ncbi:MAG TPA: 3'(2'),5'-bisphosphate nucleotidase CysQ [Steroidobacteraceae bacterium]
MQDAEILEIMIDAAREAGAAAHQYFRGELKLARKPDNTPVTAADHAAEAIILQRLGEHFGDIPIIAEEEVAAGRVPAIDHTFFLVDPLDGTREFVAGRPEYTVNIALVRERTPRLGVVYAPATGILYAGDAEQAQAFRATAAPGTQDAPARLPVCVRRVPPHGLTVVASRSHPNPKLNSYLAGYQVADTVSIGSSLKFCLVASGEADLYPRLGTTMEWDTAAGHAVLLGAGGIVVNAEGSPLRYGKAGFTNPWFIATSGFAPRPLPS